MNGSAPEIEVDARGLACPMPLLKAKQALNRSQMGERVRVLATDPGSQRDFNVFCDMSGTRLLESLEEDGVFTYLLEKPREKTNA